MTSVVSEALQNWAQDEKKGKSGRLEMFTVEQLGPLRTDISHLKSMGEQSLFVLFVLAT